MQINGKLEEPIDVLAGTAECRIGADLLRQREVPARFGGQGSSEGDGSVNWEYNGVA